MLRGLCRLPCHSASNMFSRQAVAESAGYSYRRPRDSRLEDQSNRVAEVSTRSIASLALRTWQVLTPRDMPGLLGPFGRLTAGRSEDFSSRGRHLLHLKPSALSQAGSQSPSTVLPEHGGFRSPVFANRKNSENGMNPLT